MKNLFDWNWVADTVTRIVLGFRTGDMAARERASGAKP
jgi:hypothetical protein